MNDLYNKLRQRTLNEHDEDYHASIKVYLHKDGALLEDAGDVGIYFDIDINYTSSGIRGIVPIIGRIDGISYTEVGEGEQKTSKVLTVRRDLVEIEWVEAGGYFPMELEVTLNPDDTVKSAMLQFGYLKPV